MSKIKQFVLGTSKLLTRSGYIPISELHGLKEKVQTWNGKAWSNVTITSQHDVSSDVYEIKFNTGHQITVSEYVEFYQTNLQFSEHSQMFIDTNRSIDNKYAKSFTQKTVSVSNLEVGDQILPYIGLNLNHSHDMTFLATKAVDPVVQYVNGAASAHSIGSDSLRPSMCVNRLKNFKLHIKYAEDPESLAYMETGISVGPNHNLVEIIDINSDILNQYVIPLSDSLSSRLNWLTGYIDNQCVNLHQTYYNTGKIVLFAHNIKFAQQLQLLFHSLGVHTHIKCVRFGDHYQFANDEYDLSEEKSYVPKGLNSFVKPHSRVLGGDVIFDDIDDLESTCYLILETNDILYLKRLGLNIIDYYYIANVEPREELKQLYISSITCIKRRHPTVYSVSESAGGMVTIDGLLMKVSN